MKCDLKMQPEYKILLKLQLVTYCCSLEMSYTLVSQQAIRKVVSSLLVTMYQIVRDTTNQYFKKKHQNFFPDNFVFRLHYKYTFCVLMISSIMLSCYEYIDTDGSAIQCVVDHTARVPQEMVNTFCWFSSTYTLPRYWEGRPGEDIIHYGVGPYLEDYDKVYHAYYQWVPLMFAMQAVMFHLPHFIWKIMEGGRIEQIIGDLNDELSDQNEHRIADIAEYMKQRMRHPHEHQVWSANFIFCEFLNLLNVIFQIVLTNRFLGGTFYTYFLEVFTWSSLDPEDRVEPMSKVFPRLTKCDFHKFGPSGTIQNIDALCILSMNILNEKIFIFIWFWFLILGGVTTLNLLVRLFQRMVPSIRRKLILRTRMLRCNETERFLSELGISDWMILYHLSHSMHKGYFSELIDRMVDDDVCEVFSDENDINDDPLPFP